RLSVYRDVPQLVAQRVSRQDRGIRDRGIGQDGGRGPGRSASLVHDYLVPRCDVVVAQVVGARAGGGYEFAIVPGYDGREDIVGPGVASILAQAHGDAPDREARHVEVVRTRGVLRHSGGEIRVSAA